jgi:hypothetical protein
MTDDYQWLRHGWVLHMLAEQYHSHSYMRCALCCSGVWCLLQSLAGIDILRKITNHPDLLERLTSSKSPDYGGWAMVVVGSSTAVSALSGNRMGTVLGIYINTVYANLPQ